MDEEEREALARLIRYETGEAAEESGFLADAILAAGFRRTVQGELTVFECPNCLIDVTPPAPDREVRSRCGDPHPHYSALSCGREPGHADGHSYGIPANTDREVGSPDPKETP